MRATSPRPSNPPQSSPRGSNSTGRGLQVSQESIPRTSMGARQESGLKVAPANMGLIEAPVFYFFIATTGDLDPRTIGDKDQRLKPMNVDPDLPLQAAIPALQSEFIKFVDFETDYVCRLYVPKGNVMERSWLTLRKSLAAQNVTQYDYVVLYPLKLHLETRLRSWQAEMSSWLTKRSIKGDRFTDRKKRWVVLSHQFLLYFEKPEPSSFPLGIFALDFCKVEQMTEIVKKGFGKEKEASVLRFTPVFSFGKSNPPAFELSSDDEGQIAQWHSLLCQKMAGWSEI